MKQGWTASVRVALVLSALGLLAGCTDADAVNAAFLKNRVTWYIFDPHSPSGIRELPGFDQELSVDWFPRDRAVRAAGLETLGDGTGAVAISFLGMVILSDRSGSVESFRPGSKLPLQEYRTDGLFTWNDRLFIALGQEPPGLAPPAALAWWEKGQPRVVLYPVPSQLRDSSRQSVGFVFDPKEPSSVTFTWKSVHGVSRSYDRTRLILGNGSEGVPDGGSPIAAEPAGPEWTLVRNRLARQVGLDVGARAARGTGPALVFTETGWTSVADRQNDRARLFRLPDLGSGGRYTGALALSQGWVFTWEVSARGYLGASGLVHVPRGVLAP